jgi:hypothetical protein
MAKVVKKGVKPTSKKAVAKKATAKKRVAVNVTKKTTKGGTTITRKATKAYSTALAKTPDFFKAGRSMDKLAKDFEHKGKVAKMSKNGKWYVEYKGKDGKKHREYRANRMDYKFGI